MADRQFSTTRVDCRQIVGFLLSHGPIQAIGVEGTGSYGAELARALAAAGMSVIEVMRTNRQHRRIKGKSDPLDARQAALTVAAGRSTVAPKQRDGHVESLRILLAERASAVKARTAAMNQIHALLVTAEDEVRADYRRYDGEKLVAILARTRPAAGHGPAQVARGSLKRLATRHQDFSVEIAGVDAQLEHIVRQLNPALLAVTGVGPGEVVDAGRFGGLRAYECRRVAYGAERRTILTHSPELHEHQARGFEGTTLAKATKRLDELAATLARGKTRRPRPAVEAEITKITKITHDPWVRRVITWHLGGEKPKDLRLDWH